VGAPSDAGSRLQGALAAVSLALLSLCVALPVAAAVLALLAAVLWAGAAATLAQVGALDRMILGDAVVFAGVLLGGTLLAAAVGAVTIRRRPALPGMPQGPVRPARSAWTLRHPWISSALIALFIDACLVPARLAGLGIVPGSVLGAGILAGAALIWIFAAYGVMRAWWFGLRTLWAGSRRSAFFAGAVTAGSFGVTLAALLLGQGLARTAEFLSAPRELPACSGSLLSCSGDLLRSSYAAGARRLPAPEEIAEPDPPPGTARCFEEMHRAGPDGTSARDAALDVARRITRDPSAAEDVVQAMLLSVCLRNERRPVQDLRPYLIRAVAYAAQKESRRSRRYCPLEPDDPTWLPDACVDDRLPPGMIEAELEASAYNALCALPADQRRLIELHLRDGLSHGDIARRLRCSEPAARQRYHRALVALKERFFEQCR
jgi:RNA polymerase sigma factor (sigma-70 family)